MSELLMTPSRKEYKGEKMDLTKEALKKSLEVIKKMSGTEVKDALENYKDVNFSTKSVTQKTNTLEMTALYQRGLTLLGYNTDIDARFGPTTRENLKKAQEEKLKLIAKNIDGLPGPTTTIALIVALGNTIVKTDTPTPVAAPAEDPMSIKLKAINEFLTKKEGYIKDDNDNYTNKDGDLTLTIKDGKVDFTRSLKRVASSWDLNEAEKYVIATVNKLLQ